MSGPHWWAIEGPDERIDSRRLMVAFGRYPEHDPPRLRISPQQSSRIEPSRRDRCRSSFHSSEVVYGRLSVLRRHSWIINAGATPRLWSSRRVWSLTPGGGAGDTSAKQSASQRVEGSVSICNLDQVVPNASLTDNTGGRSGLTVSGRHWCDRLV